MPDWRVLAAILALGLASYAMRADGFVAVGSLPEVGRASQVLRLAPGNLFVAFVLAFETMAVTRKEWAALGVGFAAAAATAALLARDTSARHRRR